MVYFRCTSSGSGKGNTVTVTCAEEFAGLPITLAKIGKTYTKTCPSTAPYVVTFYGVENGTYTVSCTVDGQTYSETVVVQDVSCVLNYGFNWKLWVDTASQLDSSDYNSLDEVLADEKALRELFLEHACVDYIAEATSSNADLETIIENDLCAKWINNSDYALDFLGANTIIKALMDEADKYGYGEWCLMSQVPKMTSNTAPYGECGSTVSADSSYPAWKAFDNDTTTPFQSASGNTNGIVYYHFVSALVIKKYRVYSAGGASTRVTKGRLVGSNDGINWTPLTVEKSYINGVYNEDVSENNTAYSYYGIEITEQNNTTIGMVDVQFYAWNAKGAVPKMTSATAPYGTVSASGTSEGDAYKPFDGLVDRAGIRQYWWHNSTSAYLQYAFVNPICPKKAKLYVIGGATAQRTYKYKIQGSNDGSTWTDLTEQHTLTMAGANAETQIEDFNIETDNYYMILRLNCGGSDYESGIVYELEFYGRELKVSVPTMTSNTAPYGEASASSEYSATYGAHRAFDGLGPASNIGGWSPSASANQLVKYKFNTDFVLKKVFAAGDGTSSSKYYEGKVVVSDDGISFNEVSSSEKVYFNNTWKEISISEVNDAHKYVGFSCSYFDITSGVLGAKLQFYGKDYSEKEFEAGTTKKWLYDHGVELETLNTSSDSVQKNADSIYVSGSDQGFSTANLIDLTDFSVFRFRIEDVISVTANYSFVGVGTEINGNGANRAAFSVGYMRLYGNIPTSGYDLESVNGNYSFTFTPAQSSEYFTVKELWLE